MIILILGEFGVGKDIFANMLHKKLENSKIIKSYSTRQPRYKGENTHIFISHEDFNTFNKEDMVAYSKVGENHYCALENQFSEKYNIYVIDSFGASQVIDNYDTYVIEIIRPKWLIDIDEDRINRKHEECNIKKIDFRVINDSTLIKLDQIAQDVADKIMEET